MKYTHIIDGARVTATLHFAHWLPRKLGVRGITLGSHLFFSEESVPPAILAEEMFHVTQWGIPFPALYLWSCRRGYERSRYEIEAKAFASSHFLDFPALP